MAGFNPNPPVLPSTQTATGNRNIGYYFEDVIFTGYAEERTISLPDNIDNVQVIVTQNQTVLCCFGQTANPNRYHFKSGMIVGAMNQQNLSIYTVNPCKATVIKGIRL